MTYVFQTLNLVLNEPIQQGLSPTIEAIHSLLNVHLALNPKRIGGYILGVKGLPIQCSLILCI
jgi:hypothetical protein